jgi:hypothetical protein
LFYLGELSIAHTVSWRLPRRTPDG